MQQVSPSVRSLARRLLRTYTPGESTASEPPQDALIQSCEALRPRLTQLVGREGFRALLSRALALARGEQPWLCSVEVDAEGTLAGLAEARSERTPGDGEAGEIAVLSQVLGLLLTFIGAELTRQIVSVAWPHTPLADTDFGTEAGNP